MAVDQELKPALSSYQSMNQRIMKMGLVSVLVVAGVGIASAAESPSRSPTATEKTKLDKWVGQPVDIAPWAYAWRADLAVQEKPEAYFIPRRLERIDKVYRTAFSALPSGRAKEHLLSDA